MRFKDFGFLLAAIIGLGLAPPQHEALSFAQLDGAQYENTIKPQRQFSLTGRWAAATPTELDSGVGALCRLLDRDRIVQRQPLVLLAQATACGQPIGELVRIPAIYAGGLEGHITDLPSAAGQITFTQYIPFVQGHDQGWGMQTRATVNNADYLVQRSAAGLWGAVAGLNGTVNAITIGPDGALYAGGAFTNAGGVAAADFIAKWDGSAWTALGTGGNSTVNAIVFDAAGNLYAGGNFTLMGGVANTAGIAKWNGSAWSALSTGLTGGVSPACYAIVIDQLGDLYAGGAFTDAGGSGADNLAKWNGAAWAVVGSATAINSTVTALVVDAANILYAGGSFTDAGGIVDADRVARWNGTVWDDMYGGMNNNVSALAIGANGIIYAGGAFTVAGGVTVGYIAQWNGIAWSSLGSGLNNAVTGLDIGLSGKLYAGGIFTTANGITLPDSAAIWNGYTWLPLDIDLPGAPTVTAVTERADGALYVGYSTSGAAGASAPSVVTNDGTTAIWPRFTITGPTSGTARLYQLVNVSTGAAIYFNYTMQVGETAVLNLDPTNTTFVSTTRGNIINTILPGSNLAGFSIQPGDTIISTFTASSTMTARVEWKIGYNNLSDALYLATP